MSKKWKSLIHFHKHGFVLNCLMAWLISSLLWLNLIFFSPGPSELNENKLKSSWSASTRGEASLGHKQCPGRANQAKLAFDAPKIWAAWESARLISADRRENNIKHSHCLGWSCSGLEKINFTLLFCGIAGRHTEDDAFPPSHSIKRYFVVFRNN